MSTLQPRAMPRPRLSVIVPTVKGAERWSSMIRALEHQARRAGAEVVLATAHDVPADPSETVRVVHRAGADVFELRSVGIDAASGEFIAVIEDHILVPDDWCESILEAFARHPEADGIVGGVTNGAMRCLDRASFLLTWAPFLAPIDSVPLDRCPPPGVIAFRASAIPPGLTEPGYLEFELTASLRAEGRLVAAPEVAVEHIQFVGWRGFSLQFHSGVAYGGLTNLSVSERPRSRRLRDALALPRVLVGQTNRGLRRVGMVESVPCRAAVAAMALSNAVGQVIGIARHSVGRSPSHLE
jgi:hypothetical protein